MNDNADIKFLRNNEIDKQRWDDCMNEAGNGLIYGYSWYLDRMATNWDGLVLNDYEAVMPLPWSRKFCIHYIYQPFLAAQLGIFAKEPASLNVPIFLNNIPRKFFRIDLPLNEGNAHALPAKHFIARSNYVLDLARPYDELFVNYREQTRRNIRKAQQQGCKIEKEIEVEKVIDLAKSLMVSYGPGPSENINRFRSIYTFLKERNMATTYGISLDGNLLASCVFFFSHNRAYYILVGNHPDSKNYGVSHALIDAFIKDHAGKKMLLDFEGSDISSLAFFYSSFGAEKRIYPGYHMRRV